jgi:hypothetical protein
MQFSSISLLLTLIHLTVTKYSSMDFFMEFCATIHISQMEISLKRDIQSGIKCCFGIMCSLLTKTFNVQICTNKELNLVGLIGLTVEE